MTLTWGIDGWEDYTKDLRLVAIRSPIFGKFTLAPIQSASFDKETVIDYEFVTTDFNEIDFKAECIKFKSTE
jgi:hypothetical protein